MKKKLSIILTSNFPIKKTGIFSTASSLIHEYDGEITLYCDESIEINHHKSKFLNAINYEKQKNENTVVFTHIECSLLPLIQKKLPNAKYHVGDWPGLYIKSLLYNGYFKKAIYSYLRLKLRMLRVRKQSNFYFVSQDDTFKAKKNNLINSKCLPIGVNKPIDIKPKPVNLSEIVFSGNFAYEPNRLAAEELIHYFKYKKEYSLYFVGFNSFILKKHKYDNINIVGSVDSVVDYLYSNRKVYVSLIRIGSGSKNKILEALVCGLPVICTAESLDSFIKESSTVRVIENPNQIENEIESLSKIQNLNETLLKNSKLIKEERSWKSLADSFFKF